MKTEIEIRGFINADPTVRTICGLRSEGLDKWCYLIETTFDTFPRYVVGRTNGKEAWIIVSTGALWTAAQHFEDLTCRPQFENPNPKTQ